MQSVFNIESNKANSKIKKISVLSLDKSMTLKKALRNLQDPKSNNNKREGQEVR